MKNRLSRLLSFIAARLTPGADFGLHLTIGVALMVCAAWVFGDIAEDVIEQDDITVIDTWLSNWFHTHAASGWTPIMLFITHWHNTIGITLMALMLALHFHMRKAYYWLLTLVVTVPGGMLLNVLLKYVFQRERPSFENPLVTLATYSFPSGHAAGSTLFYGVLAAYLVCVLQRWRLRGLVVVAACAMVGIVALSRVYLGAHYLSDVVAGMVVGCGWLATCITGSSTLRRRRAARAAD